MALYLTALCLLSCGSNGSENAMTKPDQASELSSSETSSRPAKRQGRVEPDTGQMGGGMREIESRLEGLISVIEQKENSLLAREQDLLDREQRLRSEAESLRSRERSVQRLQIFSWFVLVIGLAGIVSGFAISRKNRDKPGKDTQPVKNTAKEIHEKTRETKDAYVKKLELQLKDWEAKLDELKTKASEAKDEVRADYKKQTAALGRKLTAARKKLQALKDAGEGAWQEMSDGVEKAWSEMKKAIENAVQKIK